MFWSLGQDATSIAALSQWNAVAAYLLPTPAQAVADLQQQLAMRTSLLLTIPVT